MNIVGDETELLKVIGQSAYAETFQELYIKTKKELQNASAFIELQKNSIQSGKIGVIYECLCEIRLARSLAPLELQTYFDSLIQILEKKMSSYL